MPAFKLAFLRLYKNSLHFLFISCIIYLYRLARQLLNKGYNMKSNTNTIAIIASLVIIFAIACIAVGNLILVIFAIIPAFLFFVAQVLKELTSLNDQEKNEGYTFVYNIAANEYFMASSDTLAQYKNNASFIIPN